MKIFLFVIGLAVLLLGLGWLLPVPEPVETGDPENRLPWQIQVGDAGQTRVFGLEPGISTLAQARQILGDDLEVAIVAAPNETGSLEAYYERILLGPIQARMILTLEVSPETLEAMRKRSPQSKYMESATRKIALSADDRASAEHAAIRAISLIPAASLDEAVIVQRFGEPAEKITASETLTHYLYPGKGLEVIHDAKGKEILQYVAPRDFERQIRAPLRAASQQE
jgi:hypothetical protein